MKKGKFVLLLAKPELDLIVQHLNRGVYEEVAQLLSDVYGQVQAQLPQAKLPPATKKILAEASVPSVKPNGASRYAKAP